MASGQDVVSGPGRASGEQGEQPGPAPDVAPEAAPDASSPHDVTLPVLASPVAVRTGFVAPQWVDAASSLRRRPRRQIVPRWLRRLCGPLLLAAVWQLLSSLGVLSDETLAPPSAVAAAGWDLASSGELVEHLVVSLRRVTTGLAYGVTAGIVLAVVSGLFRLGDDLLDSAMQVLRGVPVLGMMPLVILWFGIGESPKVVLVALGTVFPVYVNTYAGIRGVDARLIEAASTLGVSRLGLVRRVILPGALPQLLVGLRFALTAAWLIMIIAEQINSQSGIGYLMNEARMWHQTDVIVFGLVVYGALGLATDGLVRLAERTLLSWRRGFTGT